MSMLSLFYDGLTSLRNRFYESGVFKSEEISCPVISIGNLTVGGTGKTPMIDFLISHLESKNISVGIVSRGYKGSYKGHQEVILKDEKGPSFFGDEPYMLKKRHPQIPIFVCASRVEASKKLLEAYPDVQLILADDAFQHRALKRDRDIIVFDTTLPISNYKLLPEGVLRENPFGVNRAQWIIMNKWNLCSGGQAEEFYFWLRNWKITGAKSRIPAKVLVGEYKVTKLVNLLTQKEVRRLEGPLMLASGIGRPESYSQLMKDEGFEVKTVKEFGDHHNFTRKDLVALVKEAHSLPLVVTEKDAVKIKPQMQGEANIWMAKMEMSLKDYQNYENLDRFYEDIVSLVR